MRDLREIILHTSDTKPDWMSGSPVDAKVAEIRRWHVNDNGWNDIGYHFVIDRDGTIGMGRPLDVVGAHVKGHNEGTIGICLIGGHGSDANDKFEDHFTPAQDRAVRTMIQDLMDKYPTITKVSGHNEYAAKACPGFRVGPWYAQEKPRGVAGSKTVTATGIGAVSTVATGVTAVSQLDGNTQLVTMIMVFVTMLALAFIFRERLRKWANGDR